MALIFADAFSMPPQDRGTTGHNRTLPMHKHFVVLIATFLLTGCSTYYRVTDTRTGDTYYTRSHALSPLSRPTPTSLTFTDLQSGDLIWLPSPVVAEIPKRAALSAVSASASANESPELIETASFSGAMKP
jgi:hypothetical protein